MSINKASYKPTASMISAAKRGLKLRAELPPSRRGGTSVGLARARDIINGKELSESTVLRMHSFFSRHAVDAQAQGFRAGEDGYPSKGLQAHLLWGGSPGRSWSKKLRDQIMRNRKKQMDQKIDKAKGPMNHLLMAYSELLEYQFDGAQEMRMSIMEIIHALEPEVTSGRLGEVETEYDEDEYEYSKEIVMEDGQFCVRSKDGSRNFGCYISRVDAEERLRQIESYSKKLKNLSSEHLQGAYEATQLAIENDLLSLYVNKGDLFAADYLTEEELIVRENHPAGQGLDQQKNIPLATIVKAEKRYTMGPVYVPGLEDAHGETIEANELQESIWDWVRKGDRNIFLQHSEKVAGEMVEILTWPMPIETSLIVPGEGVTKYAFPEDTPFMGVIWEEWSWDLVKSGQLRGYSIGGQAQRVEVDLSTVS